MVEVGVDMAVASTVVGDMVVMEATAAIADTVTDGETLVICGASNKVNLIWPQELYGSDQM